MLEAAFDDLLPPRVRGLTGRVVVFETDGVDAETLGPLLELSAFQAQQLLRRGDPIHMVFNAERAAGAVEAARAAGISVHTFAQASLDELPTAAAVLRLELPRGDTDRKLGYRHERDTDMLRLRTTRQEVRLRPEDLALLVVGRIDIELERQVSTGSIFKSHGDDPLERISSRPRVRDYDGRIVFDLWTHDGRAFRLLELQTTVSGDGFVEARRGAAFGQLRGWLLREIPTIQVADGYARYATPRRRRLDRVASGIPWSPTSRSGVVAQQVRDTGSAWDGWSAACFRLWQLRRTR